MQVHLVKVQDRDGEGNPRTPKIVTAFTTKGVAETFVDRRPNQTGPWSDTYTIEPLVVHVTLQDHFVHAQNLLWDAAYAKLTQEERDILGVVQKNPF